MSRNLRTNLYLVAVVLVAVMLGVSAWWHWPVSTTQSDITIMAALVFAVALAGRFPFKVSPQGDASLMTVPLFMAVLSLHPTEAALVGVLGTLISEIILKARWKVLAFNVGLKGIIGATAGIVFWSLRPEVPLGFFDPQIALAAIAAVLVAFASDVLVLFGMITIIKGSGFWQRWKEAWKFEMILEISQFSIGFIGAQMLAVAPWTLVVLAVPMVVAYYALSRSVREVVEKTALAEELDNNLKQLRETQAQLIQSAKLATVGTLAAGIAHEINNPLAVISGRAEILISRIEMTRDDLDIDKMLSGIGDIHEMSGRISGIVHGLLSYSRRADEVAVVNLDQMMDDALPLLERKLENKSISLVRDYRASPMVNVVPTQLQQVFMNLVSNAVDSMDISGTITLGCDVTGEVASAYVKDTGSGIPPEVIERMFEPFFTTKDVGEGTGLGLFICHKIISDHGGELTVESEQGVGTTFRINLPAVVKNTVDDLKVPVAA